MLRTSGELRKRSLQTSMNASPSSRFSSPRQSVISRLYFSAFNFSADEANNGNGPFIIKAKDLPQAGRSATPSTSSTSLEQRQGVNNWAPSSPNAVSKPATPKYPVFKEGLLRKQCQDSIQEKSPKILIERLKLEGFLPWSELSVVEKRLVDFNPAFFELSIDLPEFVEPHVKMIRQPSIDQLDRTGHKGGLRPAVDEDFAWLPDVEFVCPVHKFSIRECAVIAFTPPRCFIMCDKEGIEDEERLNEISDGLRESYTRSPPREDDVDIRPGVAIVGIRRNVFMRVVVLEADIRKPIKVRCACMDYNAIYSFDRDELFPLPAEFSPKVVPVNIFLGRFRGTHYVFKDKYVEVNNAMCQPNRDEGMVSFVTCAIYGAAPDGLTIVDAAMPDDNGWVSLVMIRSSIAAPMIGDPAVRCSAAQAETFLRQRYAKKEPLTPSEKKPALHHPKSEEVSDDSEACSGEITESVKSEVDLSEKEIVKADDMSEEEKLHLRNDVCGESTTEEADTDVDASDEALVIAKKQEEERRMFEELEQNVMTTTDKSISEISEVQEKSSDVSHPEDEVKDEKVSNFTKEEAECSEQELCEAVEQMLEKKSFSTDEDTTDDEKFDHMRQLSNRIVNEIEEEVVLLSESNVEKKEQIAKLEAQLHRLLHPENEIPTPTNKESDSVAKPAEDERVSSPPIVEAADVANNDIEDGENDVDVEDLHNILEAYIAARRFSKASPAFVSAMDFSVISAINTAGRLLIGKDSVSADADEQTAIVDLHTAAELAFKDFIGKNGIEEER